MTESNLVGRAVREVATQSIVYQNCKVVASDAVALTIEVERTISEGGNVETVVSQILIPWLHVQHVIVTEERT